MSAERFGVDRHSHGLGLCHAAEHPGRAAAGIRDARSDEMLVAALADDDAANVQLAARYLGMLRIAKAVPVLEQVARAEGRGNRENGPRIAAE